jgi:hypothetical protein
MRVFPSHTARVRPRRTTAATRVRGVSGPCGEAAPTFGR